MRRIPLSVVIVTWNRVDETMRCLASLFAGEFVPEECWVIDNASSDDTVARVAREFPQVRLVGNAHNVGHAKGAVQGFARCEQDHVLLLDNDTELEPGALEALWRFARLHPEFGVVSPRLFNTDGSIQPVARSLPKAASALFGRQSVLTRWFPGNRFSRRYLRLDELRATEPFEVESVSAAAMLFKRSLLRDVAGWDPGYRGYWVDTDWCCRLRKAGVRLACVPASRIVHHEQNAGWKKKRPDRIWMFHAGALRYYRLHATRGVLDPRLWFAALGLGARAAVLIGINSLRRDHAEPTAKQSPRAAPAVSVEGRRR